MQFADVVAARRMCRAFDDRAVDAETIDTLLRQALRAPSAGNTSSLQFLVLEGAEQTSRYWDTTLANDQRGGFPWPALLDAPVLVVPWVEPQAYVDRYSEPDKAATGLGETQSGWPVPYWFVDGGGAVMTLLLGAVDVGLGALFFGLFDHEDAVRREFGVPAGMRAVGSVALGHPLPTRQSLSARREKPGFSRVVHRGQW